MPRASSALALASLLALSFACDDREAPAPTQAAPAPSASAPQQLADHPELPDGSDCDPIVPGRCGYPFPSDAWTVADPASPTGRRVRLREGMMPTSRKDKKPDPRAWDDSDGFSPGQGLLLHLPGATDQGWPTPTTLARSIEADCPTALIEADTGRRVPHFTEIDRAAKTPEDRTIIVRPVERLRDATRYIVALRRVVDAQGQPVAPSPAFQALRDRTPSTDPAVEHRRGHFEKLFDSLDRAGVGRADLQVAWDYTTASRDNNTSALVSMRDQALALVGAGGPDLTITQVEPDPHETLAYRISGAMTAPLFLDQTGPGARLLRGADGKPRPEGTASFPFQALVPKAALQEPAAVVWFGHGLVGSHTEAGAIKEQAQQSNLVVVATDWIGMAEDDLSFILGVISSGEIHRFRSVMDRLHQGVLNALLATRMASGKLAQAPELNPDGKPLIDPSRRYYFGNSQGGILGGTYMALSTDVERGILAVPGMPYNLLLNRSEDFGPFFAIFKATYSTTQDIQLALSLMQMFWDRTEPTGYAPYIRQQNLPGTPPHEVLIVNGIGDHQVTAYGAHVLARAVGARLLRPVNRSLFGIEEADGPISGSALIELDYGAKETPYNTPATGDPDPHGRVKGEPAIRKAIDQFLKTGTAQNFCEGPCDPG